MVIVEKKCVLKVMFSKQRDSVEFIIHLLPVQNVQHIVLP